MGDLAGLRCENGIVNNIVIYCTEFGLLSFALNIENLSNLQSQAYIGITDLTSLISSQVVYVFFLSINRRTDRYTFV